MIEVEYEVTEWEEMRLEEALSGFEMINEWPKGEWDDEPDYVSFNYREHVGEIRRNTCGALCGYATLQEDHPWASTEHVHIWDIPAAVHGGITFAERGYTKDNPEIKVFVVGFDCAHFTDLVPGVCKSLNKEMVELEMKWKGQNEERFNTIARLFPRTYRNINYVKCEIMSLIDQAIEAEIGSRI